MFILFSQMDNALVFTYIKAFVFDENEINLHFT